MSVKVYVEGGPNPGAENSKSLRIDCRRGFRNFFEKSGLAGHMPTAVPCGPRNHAYQDFKTALKVGDGHPMLLVDAEGPVTRPGPWEHLRDRDSWPHPAGATDEQCHLMVQVMESWFLADRETLASYYGHGFNQGALPHNPSIEQVPKADVLRGLDQATRATRKGPYRKGDHSFDILGKIEPSRVEAASLYAKRFLDTLRDSKGTKSE